MIRLIPGKTKVRIELFKGVTLADITVGVIVFFALIFVVLSSLPFKPYIVIAILAVTALLVARIDAVPNYLYLLHILRHFGYPRSYGRAATDELLITDQELRQEAAFEKYQEDQEEDLYANETKKERSKRLKEEAKQRKKEDKLLKSKIVSDDIKDEIRARREKEAAEFQKKNAAAREQSGKKNPIQRIMAFSGIRDNYIEYGGDYFGAVLEIPAVEFRFFSEHRRTNSIEGGLGKVLRGINSNYSANIVKIERPISYDIYLEKEYEKLDNLRLSYEKGMITESELQSRVEIMYDRINEVEGLCTGDKVIEPFYYLVLFESDRRQLDIQISNAIIALQSGEMKPKRLNSKELAVFLKYSNYLDFDEKEIDKLSPDQYAEWAMPEHVRINARTVEVNRIVTHNMYVVNYPTTVGDAWMAGVFSMPATKCVMKVRPMERSKAIKVIDRSLQELRGQFMSTSVDSKLIELNTHIETLGNLLSMLQQDNEVLLEVSVYVTAYDLAQSESNPKIVTPENSNLPRISNMKKTVRRTYQESGMRLNNLEFEQMQGFIGSQISGYDPMQMSGRGMPSNSVAAAYPWIYASVSDVGGIHLGKSQGVPVFIDFFRRDSERVNSNMVIVGKSGSGKSYATKSLLANLAAEDSKIFILDPENEYTELANNLHGKFINVGNAQFGRLNPFHIITALDDDDDGNDGESGSYATHLQFLEEFFRQIIPDCDREAMEYLNSLVDRMYTNHGITAETDLSQLRPEDYPIFDDLYDAILMEFQKTDNEYIRSILRILMNYIAKFSTGGRNANIWNGPSTITTEENFIVFNFQSLLANRNNTIANAQMLLVLKYVDNEIIKNRDYNRKYGLNRKVVVAIDEAHVFIDNKFPVALDFMFQLAKRIRKYNGMQIVITQNIKDFVGSEEIARKSTAIINACQYSFIFSLSPNDIGDLCTLYEKAGGINEHEQEQITTAPRGHAFTIMSPTSRSNFQVVVPTDIVEMFEKNNFISRYFTGAEGFNNWENFIGNSRSIHEQNRSDRRKESLHLEEAKELKGKVVFTEMDEDEFLNQISQKKATLVVEEISEPVVEEIQEVREIHEAAPSQATPVTVVEEEASAPVFVKEKPREDVHLNQTVQMLTEMLGRFSYESMVEEIRRNVKQELEREMEGIHSVASSVAEAMVEAVAESTTEDTGYVIPEVPSMEVPSMEVPKEEESEPTGFYLGKVTLEVPVEPAQEVEDTVDLWDFDLPDFEEEEETKIPEETEISDDLEETTVGDEPHFDIMALLAQQAERMRDISPIDMMDTYGETVIDISLEELAQYVNKIMRS